MILRSQTWLLAGNPHLGGAQDPISNDVPLLKDLDILTAFLFVALF
jgi:hypothetical protein